MKNRKVRIGIDVGGTFTDATVIDNETYEVLATSKLPTSHDAKEGVAKGIVEILEKIIKENEIEPDDIAFIAHGTTQATNALLEGDVSKVGIIGMGTGIDAGKSKSDTEIGKIELSEGKFLETSHVFYDSKKLNDEQENIFNDIQKFHEHGYSTIVASEAYSVDNPTNENKIIDYAQDHQVYATAGHEISKLYGLKTRTRTAVINASIIPKMMETANMTESSVINAGIKTPLMIMRCDGGVMTIDEVRKRPILTMLSGPAAGVAGALMYEKVSDGIFLEVGGTSTDISVIKDGNVMINYAEIGGHKTYLNSLDVRTVGIAGGSMIKVENHKIVDVGPRSAHIAGLEYETFAQESIINPKIEYVSPLEGDDQKYAIVKSETGNKYSLTLAGAANLAGMVPQGDYAEGNKEATYNAFEALAKEVNLTVEETVEQVVRIAIEKVKKVVDAMIQEYELTESMINLVGGGGSAAVVVPYLGKMTGYRHKIAENAPIISTIGVALAMIRDVVERTISRPTEDDIKAIRKEAFDLAVKSGAQPETVEVLIEVDKQKNIVRGIATGATELRTKDLLSEKLEEEDLKRIAAQSMDSEIENTQLICEIGNYMIFEGRSFERKFFGLIKSKTTPIRVIDKEGIIRLQKDWGKVRLTYGENALANIQKFIEDNTIYGDGGEELPQTYIVSDYRIIDLSGLGSLPQIISIAEVELAELKDDDYIAILVCR